MRTGTPTTKKNQSLISRKRNKQKVITKNPIKEESQKVSPDKKFNMKLGSVPNEYYFVINGIKYSGGSIVECTIGSKFEFELCSDDPEFYALITEIKKPDNSTINFTINNYPLLKECREKNLPFEKYPDSLKEMILKRIKESTKFTYKDCSKSLQEYVLTH